MKKLKTIKDIIYNNPRADKQDKGSDDKIENELKRKMLYDDFIKKCRDACRPNITKKQMYNQSIKLNLSKDIIKVILKKLKYNTLDEYVNNKLQEELSKK